MNGAGVMTTEEIETVFERVRTWPPERKAYAALLLLQVDREGSEPFELSDEDMAELDRAEASGPASEAAVDALLGPYR